MLKRQCLGKHSYEAGQIKEARQKCRPLSDKRDYTIHAKQNCSAVADHHDGMDHLQPVLQIISQD